MSKLNLIRARRRQRLGHGPRCVMCSAKLHKPKKKLDLAALAVLFQAPAEIEVVHPNNPTRPQATAQRRQLP